MKKLLCILSVVMLLMTASFSTVLAQSNGLSISIMSPGDSKSKPIFESIVKTKVTNNSNISAQDLLVYITIIDTRNNVAVAVDEYGATVDKPRKIQALAANESAIVEIPIRFMYTGDYELYTSVMNKSDNKVISSEPITINMLGDSKINKTAVIIVSIIMPLLLIGMAIILPLMKKHKAA